MSLKSRFLVTAAFATLACSGFAADLKMQVVPAFEGFSPSNGTVPVAVKLRNDGPNARGVVRITGGDGYQMEYPVELPRGSEKRLLTYPTVSYAGLQYRLETDQGGLIKSYEPLSHGYGEGTQVALLISDSPGELAFIKGNEKLRSEQNPNGQSQQVAVQDAYTSYDLAPNRPVGYANVSAVILGSGAERLNDEQVQALKTYALAGGTLVFVGGASSPILGDVRWQELLPARDFSVATLRDSRVLEQLGGEAAPVVSVTSGTPVPGAITRREGNTLLTAERGFGIGKVVYLAFNPFEPPLNRWEGRRSAVTKSIRLLDSLRAVSFLTQFAPSSDGDMAYTSGAFVPSAGTSMAHTAASARTDPFSTKLPPAERVFTLLGAYFLVVIPLNFLILKKLKRGELAWFTAPLISLGFAGAFFASAQDLYSAQMSSAAQGVILGQQGIRDGLFVGASQMFVPRSGTYDLKLQGVDSLGIVTSQAPYYGGYSERNEGEFDPVDVGEIVVPRMQANNLAFREIEFRQRVPIGDWFSLETKRLSGDKVRCIVRNRSTYPLVNASVCFGDEESDQFDLAPGSTKELEVSNTGDPATAGSTTWSLPQFLSRYRGIALIGTMKGYQPGPQLGKPVEDRTSIRLALFAKEALGPR